MMPAETSYRKIPLTKGQFAIIDADDYRLVRPWKWQAYWAKKTQSYYAIRTATNRRGGHYTVYMHREILDLKLGDPRKGDHIESGKTLDNRRFNLRISNNNENSHNCRIRKDNKSGFKGVRQVKTGKYIASITVNKKHFHLGTRDTPEEAHELYKAGAIKYHQEFANDGTNWGVSVLVRIPSGDQRSDLASSYFE